MRIKMLAAAIAVGGAIIGWAGLPQAQEAARIIAERREGLRAMGAHMEAMQAIAQAGADPRPAATRVAEMEAFFATFLDRFPNGTDAGNTRALPAVWSNRAGFNAAYAALPPQLAALRSAAEAGNVSGFATALQQTGAACGACHRQFRAR
jgi:cytochrome c556